MWHRHRTRNARLAAIHSLFSYAALRHPEHADTIARVLAIPTARIRRNLVTWLTDAEATALLDACYQTTRTGRRDHAMFALAIQTGLRVSELTGLTIADIRTGTGAHADMTIKEQAIANHTGRHQSQPALQAQRHAPGCSSTGSDYADNRSPPTTAHLDERSIIGITESTA